MNLYQILGSVALLTVMFISGTAALGQTEVPAPGTSAKIDAIKERGTLRAAAIGEFPWLPENTTGSGPQFSGPAWLLAEEYAKRLGVTIEIVSVSHETKVPILATGQADITIAPLAVTPQRQEVVDFVVYSQSSICLFGRADNPKLAAAEMIDDLNRDDITMAYFTGTPPETWAPTRFPQMQLRGVAGSGANAPIEEILARRADVAPIDNVAWPALSRQVPGLISFPRGDECLQSQEMATGIGLAVDKSDPVFVAWLRAVHSEVEDQVAAAEVDLLKTGD